MNTEYRIAALEKSLVKQQRLSLTLICLLVAGFTVGGTAVVSETMTLNSGTSTSKPLHVTLVGQNGWSLDTSGRLDVNTYEK